MTSEINMEITTDDYLKFGTIEHDMTVIKQHFKNTKFAFLEREAKIYFLESIESNVQLNLVKFFDESKKRLCDVKETGVNLGEEIKELSQRNFNLKKEIDEIKINYDKLNFLKKRYEGSEVKFQKEEEWQQLDTQYEDECNKAKELVIELEKLKEEREKLNFTTDTTFLNSLIERKQELERKQKRWSRVQYDQMLVDSFIWYDKMIGIIEMLIGSIKGVVPKKNGFDLNLIFKNTSFSIMIRNGVFVGIQEEKEELKDILKWCLRLDNPRLFYLLARNDLINKM